MTKNESYLNIFIDRQSFINHIHSTISWKHSLRVEKTRGKDQE